MCCCKLVARFRPFLWKGAKRPCCSKLVMSPWSVVFFFLGSHRPCWQTGRLAQAVSLERCTDRAVVTWRPGFDKVQTNRAVAIWRPGPWSFFDKVQTDRAVAIWRPGPWSFFDKVQTDRAVKTWLPRPRRFFFKDANRPRYCTLVAWSAVSLERCKKAALLQAGRWL